MWSLFALILVLHNVNGQSVKTLKSPCPDVFTYEPPGEKPSRWYGMITLTSDVTLYGLWINIALDSKADILGTWEGDVITTDNINFKIENDEREIEPGTEHKIRLFVKYSNPDKVPRLRTIRYNGRELCNANNTQPAAVRPSIPKPEDINHIPLGITLPSSTITPPITQESITTTAATPPEKVQFVVPQIDSTQNNIPFEDKKDPAFIGSDAASTPSVVNRGPSRPMTVFVNQAVANENGGGPVPPQGVTYHAPLLPILPYVINQADAIDINRGPATPQTVDNRTDVKPMQPFVNEAVANNNAPVSKEGYWYGRVSSVGTRAVADDTDSPTHENNIFKRDQCGQVRRNNHPNPLTVNGRATLEGQWPWHVALYRAQSVDSEYVCGAILISHIHVITAAHCVTHKHSKRVINRHILTLHLGKHNLRTSTEGVQIAFVNHIAVHDQYEPMTFKKDASILRLRDTVQFTDWVQPVCLWPEDQIDLFYVIGQRGIVVGWGYNNKRKLNEELTLVEMPIVDQDTCINSYKEFFSMYTNDYTFCAGFRNGSSSCNGDSGGGMVLNMQNRWYLRGIVTLAVRAPNQHHCDPSHYVVFTDLAKLLPWIKKTMSNDV